jgi:hypothetical protein
MSGHRVGIWVALCILLISAPPARAQSDYPRAPRLGIAFINAPGVPNPDARYRNALIVGAGWNRLPLYWNEIEQQPGFYNWGAYDPIIAGDARYGLRTTLILLGMPSFRRDGAIPAGLYAPTFSDGSDALGGGKIPHPSNAWANFVYAAVLRYRPSGVRAWEIWNEPDLGMFWNGTVRDYARLLKVAYLVIKQVDPEARVLFGGLAEADPPTAARDYLLQTLLYIAQDPARVQYNWYFDILALHTYTNPLRSRVGIERARATLTQFGIVRPIWLTETGLPVWDDYPGPTWTGGAPGERSLRGTERQQAAYVIQSTVLAWGAGAEVVFWHQLYDDCGNQAPGADAGDAHGLFRNERGAACFGAHPQPNSPRLGAGAFLTLAQTLGRTPILASAISDVRGAAFAVTFDLGMGSASQRVTVIWSRRAGVRIEVPASAITAIVTRPNEGVYALNPVEGWYTLDLPDPGALDTPFGSMGEVAYVGGMPLIMVESLISGQPAALFRARLPGDLAVPLYDAPALLITPTLQPTATLAPTPTLGATPTPRPIPTFDPQLTLAPPLPFMVNLPIISPPAFMVQWGASDPVSVAAYLVWVRIDGGEWTPWLTTTALNAIYAGEAGRTYDFAVWAVNRAGGWSSDVTVTPMTSTRVE